MRWSILVVLSHCHMPLSACVQQIQSLIEKQVEVVVTSQICCFNLLYPFDVDFIFNGAPEKVGFVLTVVVGKSSRLVCKSNQVNFDWSNTIRVFLVSTVTENKQLFFQSWVQSQLTITVRVALFLFPYILQYIIFNTQRRFEKFKNSFGTI